MSPTQRELTAMLDEYVEGESWPEEDPGNAGEPMPPADDVEVQRILRRMHRLRQELSDIEAVAVADIDRAKAWMSDLSAGPLREIAWGERALESYTRAWVARQPRKRDGTPRTKTLKLKDGTVRLSAPRNSVVMTDEVAFMAWALGPAAAAPAATHPDLVRQSAVPDAVALQRLAEGDQVESERVPEDRTWHAVLWPDPEGELQVVPGVVFERDVVDKFNATLAEGIE